MGLVHGPGLRVGRGMALRFPIGITEYKLLCLLVTLTARFIPVNEAF